MTDIKIKSSQLERVLVLSKEINDELDKSENTVSTLKKYLSSAKWHGQTKDAFVAYLELIHQYHKDLIEIMNEHEKVLKNLKKTIDDYNNSSEVLVIKGL